MVRQLPVAGLRPIHLSAAHACLYRPRASRKVIGARPVGGGPAAARTSGTVTRPRTATDEGAPRTRTGVHPARFGRSCSAMPDRDDDGPAVMTAGPSGAMSEGRRGPHAHASPAAVDRMLGRRATPAPTDGYIIVMPPGSVVPSHRRQSVDHRRGARAARLCATDELVTPRPSFSCRRRKGGRERAWVSNWTTAG